MSARPVWLVARREVRSRLRAKSLLLGTAGVVVLLIGYLLLQGYVFNRAQASTVGLAGQATVLAKPLQSASGQLGLAVNTVTVPDPATGLAQVRSGSLNALVTGSPGALQVTVRSNLDDRLRAALTGLMQQQALNAQLAEAGLKPADVEQQINGAQLDVTQLQPTQPEHGQRLGLAVLIAVLLYFLLVLLGNLVAQAVVEEKTSRVLEFLLTAVRPGQLLFGKILGLGFVGLLQLLVVGLVGVALATATGVLTAAGAAFEVLGAGLLWFLVGFFLYATLFAAVSSLVSQQREVSSAVTPITVVISVAFVVGLDLVVQNPGGGAATVLSVLPPFAPVLMPGRMALSVAPVWQIWLALALAVLTIAGLALCSRRVYAAAVLRTGRIRLRDALRD